MIGAWSVRWLGKGVAPSAALLLLLPTDVAAAPTQPGELVNPLFTADSCDFCHMYPNPDDQAGLPPYAPVRTWQGSLMANSARDPVFWAGVAVADADDPGHTELCVRCHSPRAFLEGNGAATTMDALTVEQLDGVECELCHRVMEDVGVPPGNAQYTIDDVLDGPNVPRRGPFDYTDGVPEPPHSWVADPYIGSSRFCGTCHDVTTERERVDDDGVGLGFAFNEQRTYAEWLGSDYAQPGEGFASCQDCHMPAVEDLAGCTANVGVASHATGGRRHDLVGANRFMIEVLQSLYGGGGDNTIPDVFWNTTLDRMDEFLPTAATLDVSAPEDVDLADGIADIEVTVTNNTGHKLPSGYSEGRVMWIEVVAEYAGDTVASSGLWDPDGLSIQDDAQLRTYEAIADEYETGTQFHLLLNNHWVVDSRIPPLGLVPDIQTDPVGDRYTLQMDGTWPNFDSTTYAFDTARVADATPGDDTDDVLELTVRLRYVINTAEYIEFLGDNGGMAGQDVAMLFDTAGGSPALTLAEQTLSIPIVGFGQVVGTSSGGTDTGSDTTSGADTTDGGVDTTSGTGATSGAMTTTTTMTTMTTGPDVEVSSDGTDDGGQDDDPDGCACATGRGRWTGALWLLPVLAAGRRRRRG